MNIALVGCEEFQRVIGRLLKNVIRGDELNFNYFDSNRFLISDEDDNQLIIIDEKEEGIFSTKSDLLNICIAKSGKPLSKKISPQMPYFMMEIDAVDQGSDIWKKLCNRLKRGNSKLDYIGIKYGTDKASIQVNGGAIRFGHDYLRHYERFFEHYNEKPILLCEYGCGKGFSLKVWKEYFSQGTIVGVDINPKAQEYIEDRIKIHIGNAAEMSNELREYGSFDIIIDDASHAWSDMRITLENSWNILAEGGYYVLEDICCGTYGAYLNSSPTVQDSQNIFDYLLDRVDIMRMPPNWNPLFNARYLEMLPRLTKMVEEQIDEVFIFPGTCVLKKR